MNEFQINPSYIEEGMPVTLLMDGSPEVKAQELFLTAPNGEQTTVSLTPDLGGLWTAQFALYQAGTYRVTWGVETRELVVHKRTDVGFTFEFWALAFATLLILGGLIAWTKKRRMQ